MLGGLSGMCSFHTLAPILYVVHINSLDSLADASFPLDWRGKGNPDLYFLDAVRRVYTFIGQLSCLI